MHTTLRHPGLSRFASRYDSLICDIWGVVHNGIVPYRDAVEALRHFRSAGGHVVLVSNAPTPCEAVRAMLDGMAVPRDAYDGIVTSGDVTRQLVSAFAGRIVHHVGLRQDESLFAGLDVELGPSEAAAAVVVTGLADDRQSPADYEVPLRQWLDLGLPFVCANPDHVVEVGNHLEYCAGALADIYADMGGEVRQAGKPYRPIYEAAQDILERRRGRPLDLSRTLAIGDSVRTDAAGAAGFGIELLFITGSIHAGELDAFGDPDPEAVAALVAPSGARLAGHMPRLDW